MSEIAGVSAASGLAEMNKLPAMQPAAQKNVTLSVQDEVTMAVITNITDQQKMVAEQLIEMMRQNLIDVYA